MRGVLLSFFIFLIFVTPLVEASECLSSLYFTAEYMALDAMSRETSNYQFPYFKQGDILCLEYLEVYHIGSDMCNSSAGNFRIDLHSPERDISNFQIRIPEMAYNSTYIDTKTKWCFTALSPDGLWHISYDWIPDDQSTTNFTTAYYFASEGGSFYPRDRFFVQSKAEVESIEAIQATKDSMMNVSREMINSIRSTNQETISIIENTSRSSIIVSFVIMCVTIFVMLRVGYASIRAMKENGEQPPIKKEKQFKNNDRSTTKL